MWVRTLPRWGALLCGGQRRVTFIRPGPTPPTCGAASITRRSLSIVIPIHVPPLVPLAPVPGPTHAAAAAETADAILRLDPGGVYGRSDPRTQWQYRAALETWSHRTGADPLMLARDVLARAGAALADHGPGAPGAHVGYYLLGDGKESFYATPAGPGTRALAPALLAPLVLTLTLAFAAACVAFVHPRTPGWVTLLAAIAALPLASVYASRIARTLPWRRQPGIPLPRLRAGEEWGRDETALVVIPAIVPSPARARAIVRRLGALGEAHPAAELRFALLTDFADAPAETAPDDEAVLAELREGIAALNARARDGIGDRYFALHRRRAWSHTEAAWIGWERKRGKLREVMRLLQPDPPPTTFAWRFGDLPEVLSRRSVPYVITLDESTWPAPGALAELIRAAAHPLNRPVVDEAAGRVTSGFAVLQPTVMFTLAPRPAPGGARVGAPGFAFRTFGVGTHKGAGALYVVDAFRRAVDGAFPDERVLHHDLLDGFVGRTGEVYDAVVHQPWPRTYLAQARRGHRWLRGVFQAVPFLVSRRTPLSGIHRFLITEVALQEVSTPASLALLLLAWTVLPGPAALWTLLACPALLILAVSLPYHAVRIPLQRLRRRRGPGWGAALDAAAAGLFAQVVLVYQAFLVVDALARVAWRLTVSRRHLLQWAPRDNSAAATPLAAYWRALWISPIAGGLLLAALAFGGPAVSWIAAPFALAWIAAPVVVGLGDRSLFSGEGQG
jgi:cyclic beta-1,2-glucan synthetase